MKWVSQRNPINPVTAVERETTQPHNVNLEKPHAINAKKGQIVTVCKSGQTNPNNEGKRPNARQRDRAHGLTVMPMRTLTYQVSNPSSHPITVELQVNKKTY